jgi:hypothetical protein
MQTRFPSPPSSVPPHLDRYLKAVRRDHSTPLVRSGFSLYAWFWFHTEFWLPPLDRRPYTFIMRDWIYPHLPAFLTILAAWYAGLFLLVRRLPCLALVLGVLSSLLVAHLVWGSGWQKGEQEWPPYLGDENDQKS